MKEWDRPHRKQGRISQSAEPKETSPYPQRMNSHRPIQCLPSLLTCACVYVSYLWWSRRVCFLFYSVLIDSAPLLCGKGRKDVLRRRPNYAIRSRTRNNGRTRGRTLTNQANMIRKISKRCFMAISLIHLCHNYGSPLRTNGLDCTVMGMVGKVETSPNPHHPCHCRGCDGIHILSWYRLCTRNESLVDRSRRRALSPLHFTLLYSTLLYSTSSDIEAQTQTRQSKTTRS